MSLFVGGSSSPFCGVSVWNYPLLPFLFYIVIEDPCTRGGDCFCWVVLRPSVILLNYSYRRQLVSLIDNWLDSYLVVNCKLWVSKWVKGTSVEQADLWATKHWRVYSCGLAILHIKQGGNTIRWSLRQHRDCWGAWPSTIESTPYRN